MAISFYRLPGLIAGIILLGLASVRAAIPEVVATIKPIHALVAGVMDGVGEPGLLMAGDKSPHVQSLTLKELASLKAAKVVFWIGSAYEAPLERAINSVKETAHIVTLMEKPGIRLYSLRHGDLWGSPCSCHSHGAEKPDHSAKNPEGGQPHEPLPADGHIWLDPHNAQAIVTVIAKELAAVDPQHEAIYFSNSQKVLKRLEDLDQELQEMLKPVRDKPYIAYHDGTQYFDRHFHTQARGALMGGSHMGINARHLIKICDYMRAEKIRCVFREPQFSFPGLQSLVEKTGACVATLDYLGVGLAADQHAYFIMMRRLAGQMVEGLTG